MSNQNGNSHVCIRSFVSRLRRRWFLEGEEVSIWTIFGMPNEEQSNFRAIPDDKPEGDQSLIGRFKPEP
jgi:hypothetical protein